MDKKPKVKPLVWEDYSPLAQFATAVAGEYWVQFDDQTDHWFSSLETASPDPIILGEGDAPSKETAILWANQDYERRILSALVENDDG